MESTPNIPEYGIYQDGDMVGVMAAAESQSDNLRQALEHQGYQLRGVSGEELDAMLESAAIELDAECTIEDHRPCDIKVSIAAATEVAHEAGLVSYGKLHAIQESGVVSEAEAESVLRAWATEVRQSERTSDEQRNWADIVTETLWAGE